MIFFRRKEEELKMTNILFAINTLFGILQVVRVFGVNNVTVVGSRWPHKKFDTSNYKLLSDRRGNTFSFFDAKCRGKPRKLHTLILKHLISMQ